MEDKKQRFVDLFNKLSEDRKKAILDFYEARSCEAIFKWARADAEDAKRHADIKGYGYGEVNFFLNESVKEFAEDVPELEKEYKGLVYAYFEKITEDF